MIIDFKPEYTIVSTGDKTAMYTLLEVGIFVDQRGYEKRTFWGTSYVQNLSNNRDKAYQRGAEISDELGLEFRPNAEFDLNEIKRRKKEEIEEEKRAIEEYQRKQIEESAHDYEVAITDGVFLMGKYEGKTADEVVTDFNDEQYVRWLAYQYFDESDRFTKFNASAKVAVKWVEENPEKESNYVGEVGEKIQFTAKATKIVGVGGQFPTILFRFVDESGNIIITFSTAKKMRELKEGDEVSIEATVKGHQRSFHEQNIDNNRTTTVKRPKVLKVK